MNKKLAALKGSLLDYKVASGRDLIQRVGSFFEWQDNRREQGVWPYTKALFTTPRTTCSIVEETGKPVSGINFASQDYLSLADHPAVHEAAIAAIRDFGVHSAGSAALLGNTRYSLELEQVIGEALQMDHVVLYPTGWGAGYGVVTGLVRPHDHVVVDVLSHSCLHAGAEAATRNVHRFRHNDVAHLEKMLSRIRATDIENGILVITEGLFSMDSDYPDINRMQSLCSDYEATLVVDVAHDFGSMGPGGTGTLGTQGLLGKVDLVMGSFSKTFASNGGFVAARRRSVAEYLKCYSSPQTFSNALSPVQAAVVLKAFEIVRSAEGEARRSRLAANVSALRAGMLNEGVEVGGVPSPIVPIVVGDEALIRLASRELSDLGVLANLIEYPAVAKGRARFRFQLMADHSSDDMAAAAQALGQALLLAAHELKVLTGTRVPESPGVS